MTAEHRRDHCGGLAMNVVAGWSFDSAIGGVVPRS